MKNELQNLRKQMIKLGLEKGFAHPETIKVSQQLDCLIYDIQKGVLFDSKNVRVK